MTGRASTGRVFLANVGANASHRFAGPIFDDRTFEFLPIPEDRELQGSHTVRYRDLRSFYRPGADLLEYVPRRLWDWPAHSDPEFETFTYGDNCETSSRGAALKGLRPGDRLVFLARLERWDQGRATGRFGFYLVGFLEIARTDWLLRGVRARPSRATLSPFLRNAHVRRGLSDEALWDGYWVFRGSQRSRRFRAAVPVTRALCERVFRAADGSPWRWDGHRSQLQVIGSYTRTCRCVIDPSDSEGWARAEALWEWVERHEPPADEPASASS
jgi:hypothetical protein